MGYNIAFNTTISCLITNAALTKSQANKLASILHDAFARAIKPVHGTLDGDTVFVLATGRQQVNFDAFAALATDVMQYAIIDAATSARSAYGLPAAIDMKKPENDK
jgi:L-aminopeptidase/D-esterase-like protein